jgi:hypothetical protein
MHTREDPGKDADYIYPDSQFAVMEKNCLEYRICDYNEPFEIALALDAFLSK